MSVSKIIKSIKTAPSTWVLTNVNHIGTYYHLGSNDNWLFVTINANYGGGCLLANTVEKVEMRWEKDDAIGCQLASYLRSGAYSSTSNHAAASNNSFNSTMDYEASNINSNPVVEYVVTSIIEYTTCWKYIGEANKQVVFANKHNTDWVFVRDASTSNGGFIIRNNAKNIFIRYNENSVEARRMWSALVNLYSQTRG